jgi:catechol 2,3-dioxygenase-like lactoylglutathione lyase family enzyme
VTTRFRPGRNIAVKTPAHRFHQTVSFYRDVVGLPVVASEDGTVTFAFGELRLWVDLVPTASHGEVWLEMRTDDESEAAETLRNVPGVSRCDRVEALPPTVAGFWVTSPAGIVHLVAAGD